jgi:hypothetical protein
MRCKKVRNLMSLCLDGELTLGEEEEFREHLQGCDACAREYALLERTQSLLGSLPGTDPGEDFTLEVLRRVRGLEAEAVTTSWWAQLWEGLRPAQWLRPALGMAGVLVLGLLTGVGLHGWLQGGAPQLSASGTAAVGSVTPPTLGSWEDPGTAMTTVATTSQRGDSVRSTQPEFILERYYIIQATPQPVVAPVETGRELAGHDEDYVTF